jgi:hypothetical protein
VSERDGSDSTRGCHNNDPNQANYINALAVSVSPFFEPAEVTLGGLIFFPWVDFL